jgi:hypothetical protein
MMEDLPLELRLALVSMSEGKLVSEHLPDMLDRYELEVLSQIRAEPVPQGLVGNLRCKERLAVLEARLRWISEVRGWMRRGVAAHGLRLA